MVVNVNHRQNRQHTKIRRNHLLRVRIWQRFKQRHRDNRGNDMSLLRRSADIINDATAYVAGGLLTTAETTSQKVADKLYALQLFEMDKIVYPTEEVNVALAAIGTNKGVVVRRGTYTETDTPIVLDGQHIHFDHALLNIADSKYFDNPSDDNVLTGHLRIAGTGDTTDSATRKLMRVAATRCDWSGCFIQLIPDYTTTPIAASGRMCQLSGHNCKIKVFAENVTATTASWFQWFTMNEGDGNEYDLTLRTALTSAAGANSAGLYFNGEQNIVKLCFDDITDTAGTIIGVALTGTADYNSIHGVARDIDGTTVTDAGTGNVVTGLAV